MPRRKVVARRDPAPDPRFESPLVTKFINCLMVSGKRSTAERMFYGAVGICEQKGGESGISIFKQAVANVKPVLEVKSRRVGGATYQVPVEVRPDRRTALAIRWLIDFSRERAEQTMEECLAGEFLAAWKNEGNAIRKKRDVHKMAEANKAFAHYRW
jgi:small subunit ribosomal protein S7